MITRVRVKIEKNVRDGPYRRIVVWAIWEEPQTDLPYKFGWAFDFRAKGIIKRLMKCIKDQKAFGPANIAYDAEDKTYLQITPLVRAKTANKDLKRLGY